MIVFPAAAWLALLLAPGPVLTAVDGRHVTPDWERHQATVVIFSSTACPVAADYYPRIEELWRLYRGRPEVGFYVVFPNRTESMADLRAHAAEMRFPFPVYRDEANRLADLLAAPVTPTVAVVRRDGTAAYVGPIDDATNPARVKRHWVTDAVAAVLAGRPVTRATGEPFG